MISFSVLIVTLGRPEELRETLGSIRECEPAPVEVLVIDGDPDCPAGEILADSLRGSGIHARAGTAPPGLSTQRNRGVEMARGDVVVFLDDDVTLERDFFGRLEGVYRDPTVIGATGRVVEPETRRFGRRESRVRSVLFPGPQGTMTACGYPRRLVDVERACDVEWMQGCFMSGRIEAVRRVPHDEAIGPKFEGEDEDFSYRLSRLGRLVYEPAAVLHHRQLGFTGSRGREFDRNIVLVRTYLFRKNFRRSLVSRVQFALLLVVLLAHRLVNGEFEGIAGILTGIRLARGRELVALLDESGAHG